MRNLISTAPSRILIHPDDNNIKYFPCYFTIRNNILISSVTHAGKNTYFLLVLKAAYQCTDSSQSVRIMCIVYQHLAVLDTEHIYTSWSVLSIVGESK